MIIQAQEMAKAVRAAIDMNAMSDKLLLEADSDTLTLNEIIRTKLVDAIRLVEMEAPFQFLDSGHEFGSSISWEKDGKGWVILPEDFMRLIIFKMSDWHRAVYTPISESDPRYGLQSSRWKGICGNPAKPVCAIVSRAEGKVLEFYSCKNSEATVEQAVYRPTPRIDRNGGIEVSSRCYKSCVYRAASLTLASLGDSQYTTMLEISKSLLQ